MTNIVLARGDRVIAAARSPDRLKSLESESCKTMQLDVTDSEESLKAKATEAVGLWGRVDVLVNNGGVGGAGISEEAGCAPYSLTALVSPFRLIQVILVSLVSRTCSA